MNSGSVELVEKEGETEKMIRIIHTAIKMNHEHNSALILLNATIMKMKESAIREKNDKSENCC